MSDAVGPGVHIHTDLSAAVDQVKRLDAPAAIELLSTLIVDAVSKALAAHAPSVVRAAMDAGVFQDYLNRAAQAGYAIGRKRGMREVVLPEGFSSILGDVIGRSLAASQPAKTDVVVNVLPTPVQIDNQVNVLPTPVQIDNQVIVPARTIKAVPQGDGTVLMTPEAA